MDSRPILSRLKDPIVFVAAGFALVAVIFVGAFLISEGERGDESWVRHTLEVENQLSALTATLQDAETGERGYLLTGNETYLESYRLSLPVVAERLDALAQAVNDNPRQQAMLSRLRPLIQQRLQSLAMGAELRRTQGLDAATAYVRQGRGKAAMDETRRQINAMSAEESRLLNERQARAQITRRALRLSVGLGLLALFGLTVFVLRDSARQVRLLSASRDDYAAANARLVTEAQAREAAEAQLRQVQKMESIGQLSGGIAHDFNNMLAVVIGSLELARRRLRSDPDRAEAGIGAALEGAQRAAALTARLLAFSRQQPLAPTPMDPNKLVGGMLELLRRTIGGHLNIETVLAGGVWRVNVDGQQLENAILNLCVNARDAMPEGGNLTVETGNAFLDEAYAAEHGEVEPGQYVQIAVTDAGVGMPPEVAQRAFDPFYTTKGPGQGTGLGLSQVYGFVKQSGGHIKIYSEVGRGTSVKIYLPRWTGALPTETKPADAPLPPRAKPHELILLVEDEAQVRKVAIDVLQDLGYQVVAAESGDDALLRLGGLPRVDLLLTDIVMPGMTGRALADQAQVLRPGLKVLYMTGYSRNAVVHNGVLDAGVAFLPKPFTGEQLANKVRQVIDGRGANRPLPPGEG